MGEECGTKFQYRTKKRAINYLRRIKKTGVIVPSNAHAYICSQCNYWHLGHKRKER